MVTLSLNTISPPIRMHRFSYHLPKPRLHSLCLRRLRRSPVTIQTAALGPSTASSSGFTESIGDALGQVSIFSAATGEPVLINELSDQEEGVAIVALLRHFGCPCCWELASVLRDSKSKFESAGVKLIAIGFGTMDRAHILAERLPFPLEDLYADPDRKVYDVMGLYYGLARTFFNPASELSWCKPIVLILKDKSILKI